jgi:hypothetical protein
MSVRAMSAMSSSNSRPHSYNGTSRRILILKMTLSGLSLATYGAPRAMGSEPVFDQRILSWIHRTGTI